MATLQIYEHAMFKDRVDSIPANSREAGLIRKLGFGGRIEAFRLSCVSRGQSRSAAPLWRLLAPALSLPDNPRRARTEDNGEPCGTLSFSLSFPVSLSWPAMRRMRKSYVASTVPAT